MFLYIDIELVNETVNWKMTYIELRKQQNVLTEYHCQQKFYSACVSLATKKLLCGKRINWKGILINQRVFSIEKKKTYFISYNLSAKYIIKILIIYIYIYIYNNNNTNDNE